MLIILLFLIESNLMRSYGENLKRKTVVVQKSYPANIYLFKVVVEKEHLGTVGTVENYTKYVQS